MLLCTLKNGVHVGLNFIKLGKVEKIMEAIHWLECIARVGMC